MGLTAYKSLGTADLVGINGSAYYPRAIVDEACQELIRRATCAMAGLEELSAADRLLADILKDYMLAYVNDKQSKQHSSL